MRLNFDDPCFNNLLADYHLSFRSRRSRSLALAQCTEEVTGNMERRLINGVVFIDSKIAFDMAEHSMMLRKIRATGVTSTDLA